MPRHLSAFDLITAITKGTGRPVLYISFEPQAALSELELAAPYLFDEHGALLFVGLWLEGCGYLVCEDKAELDRLYNLTVGDDGPTASNPYTGPVRVYALTSEGSENT